MKIQDCFTQVNLFVPISELYVVVVTAFNCLPLRWEETPCYVITVCKFSFCSLPLPQKTVSTGIWKTAPFPRKPNYSVYLALNIQGATLAVVLRTMTDGGSVWLVCDPAWSLELLKSTLKLSSHLLKLLSSGLIFIILWLLNIYFEIKTHYSLRHVLEETVFSVRF